ncbi:MAG: HlyC/CorC family transporter [Clostridia bacterium]|nr:HlyC/CorC family transporter [Clostridia bacterium]
MDTVPLQLLLPVLGILIVIGFLIALLKEASVTVNDARLGTLAEELEKAKRLWELLEEQPTEVIGGLSAWRQLIAYGVLVFMALGFFPYLTQWLAETGAFCYWLSGAVLALCYLLISLFIFELLPKRLGAKWAEAVAVSCVGVTGVLTVLGKPLVLIPTVLANLIARLFGVKPHDLEEEVTEEEIRMMVDMGLESGAIDDDEKEMIHNIFEMDDKPVGDIMTHRTEACVLWMEDSLEEWKTFIDETNHTRYPVCDEEIDNVVGIVNTRDFYRFLLSGGQKNSLRSIFREPYFVPDSMKADELFSRMQQKNTHMVLVLDEYGGFQGLVTQEDLLEEIVGELYSEYDEIEEKDTDILNIDENTWKIKGATLIEDVEEALNITIPEGDYNTFAGLILDAIETLPEDGETVETEIGQLQIKVTSIQEHRIEETIVCFIREEKPQEEL